jgi:hypothetical protein
MQGFMYRKEDLNTPEAEQYSKRMILEDGCD